MDGEQRLLPLLLCTDRNATELERLPASPAALTTNKGSDGSQGDPSYALHNHVASPAPAGARRNLAHI